jgi:hypothetical protein
MRHHQPFQPLQGAARGREGGGHGRRSVRSGVAAVDAGGDPAVDEGVPVVPAEQVGAHRGYPVDAEREGQPEHAVGDLGDLDAVHLRLGDPDRHRHPGQSPTCETARSSSGVGVP